MDKFSDVIIIGSGPIGLFFACKFKNSNLKITILEKSNISNIENPNFDGREIAITHPSKELLEKCGILNKINPKEIYPLKEAKVINGNSPYQLYFPKPKKSSKNKKIDCLGYLISNYNIRKASYLTVKQLSNVEFLFDTKINEIEINDDIATIIINKNIKIKSKLLICADSRLSITREKIGISTNIINFARTVIVFRINHQFSNNNTAFECFKYGLTIAVLPLKENLSSIVMTISSNKLEDILNKNKQQLSDFVYKQLDGYLGMLDVVSEIFTYPLIGSHANKFYSLRSALIGDASVGMHPVTAHGFNLGLKGANILSDLILKAEKKYKDIGDKNILQEYNFKHMLNTKPIYHGTNLIVKLFTTETAPAKILRSSIIRISNNLSIIKKIISNQLTG